MNSPLRATYILLILGISASCPAAEIPGPDWVEVTPHAQFQPRDSSGEVVFKDKLWLLGGWFDSFKPAPRDVWSSSDGKTWTKVLDSAPWKHSDLPMTTVFQDRMWIMGGWYNGRLPDHSSGNEVWSSADGLHWDQATQHADWTPRIAAGLVTFKDRMWMLGGTEDYYFGTDKNLKNDVWSSPDGKLWNLATNNAGWSPRAYHQAVVHDGKMWVLGGGNYVPAYHSKNDVWSSEDGIRWTQVTEHAPWAGRLWFSSVVYRDHIWVLGGWTKEPYKNLGDVWFSKDGKTWNQLKSNVIWKARHEHSSYVFQDKIWVVTGHAMPLNNDVWTLELPKDWNGTP
ncbi:MAG: galactose oxidase [Planctomycetales bacterium]